MMILAEATTTSGYGRELLNMFLTLFFVLGLGVITIIFLRRTMRTKMRHLNRQSGIKVLERRALNQKSSLYLVDILGKGVVISESPQGIHLITEFPPNTDLELLLAEEEVAKSQPTADSWQKKVMNLFKKSPIKS